VQPRFVDETPFCVGWIAPEPRFMQRCSHAVRATEEVWVFDAVDCEGIDERIRGLGDPAGVVVLHPRHERDAESIARRLGVSRFTRDEPPREPPFQLVRIGRGELSAWFPEHETLVVSEALGTVQYMRAPGEKLGLHPFRRLTPPRRLNAFDPAHVLVGHGSGMHGVEAAAALHDVLDHGAARTGTWLWSGFRAHLLGRR
jgi:hypothetical protein